MRTLTSKVFVSMLFALLVLTGFTGLVSAGNPCSWSVHFNDLGSVKGWNETKYIGNIVIENTGESISPIKYNYNCDLNFELTHNLPEGRIYFDGVPYKPSDVYTLGIGQSRVISVDATFLSEEKQEDFVITINEISDISTTASKNITGTLVSSTIARPTNILIIFYPPINTNPPVISDVQTISQTQIFGNVKETIVILWKTDKTSCPNWIEYGLDTGYGTNVSETIFCNTNSTISDTITRHSISLTNLNENTTYHYRVQSCDLFENCAYSEDYTFTTLSIENPELLDTTSPTIELISPKDNYVKRTKKSYHEIDFKYKVNDESEIVSCSLIVDEEVEETNTNIQRDVENVFSVKLDRGSYDWQIKCVDAEGNEGISEIRDLKIKKKKKFLSSDITSLDELHYETETISPPINNIVEEPEIITLSLKTSKESKGFFEDIFGWFKKLFN